MSTLPAVKAALLVVVDGAVDVQVDYAWNPSVQRESMFFGRPTLTAGDRDQTTIDYTYPAAETNLPRIEKYDVPLSVISFRPDLTSVDAADAEERVFALLDEALAAIDAAALPAGVSAKRPARVDHEIGAFEAGWACVVTAVIGITATVT